MDDELGHDAHAWATRRGQPTLLLDINPSWGLAAAHVDAPNAFADEVAAT